MVRLGASGRDVIDLVPSHPRSDRGQSEDLFPGGEPGVDSSWTKLFPTRPHPWSQTPGGAERTLCERSGSGCVTLWEERDTMTSFREVSRSQRVPSKGPRGVGRLIGADPRGGSPWGVGGPTGWEPWEGTVVNRKVTEHDRRLPTPHTRTGAPTPHT